jgi:hypothetical protein
MIHYRHPVTKVIYPCALAKVFAVLILAMTELNLL